MTQYQLKRAYEPASPEDGFRVYIDRLWPKGLSHETFHYDLWDKEISRRPQNSANGSMKIPLTAGPNLRYDIPRNWRKILHSGHCDIFLHRNLS